MDFGKLFNVDRVRFDLPVEDARTTFLLKSSQPPSGSVQVCVGAPAWTCANWVGTVFPRGTSAREYLSAYGRQMNSIELNSTFYRIPEPALVEAWKNAVPMDFRFAPKLHQSISHFEDLPTARKNLEHYWQNIREFGEKWGICFLQLPPHFAITSIGALKSLLSDVPEPEKLAIEFRHSSWFDGHTLHANAYSWLRDRGFSTVITDVAGRRDVLHSSLTSQKVLIRFLGNELHPSDFARIDEWVERAASWIDRGLDELYFFIHQPTQLEVPELVKRFTEGLNQRTGLSIRAWTPILEKPMNDQQMSLF